MWELDADNVLEYLREQGWLQEGPARAEVLSGGVSNVVLRVEQEGRRLVIKQSRPQLRTREAWFSDIERIWREQEVMEVLHPLLPADSIPRVLFVDQPRFIFAMEHAPLPAQPWKSLLLAGQADLSLAKRAGHLLGQIHQKTAENLPAIEPFRDHQVFVQLRADPFYRRIQERHPDLADDIEPLVQDLLTRKQALCHGDFSPKNLLVHPGGLVLVDHETAHLGEPAMDIGFFFSHLLLKTVKAGPRWGEYRDLVLAAWRAYAEVVRFETAEELLRRGMGHLGVCLLARIDGTSPVDYLPEEDRRAVVRRLGRWLVQERPGSWDEVMGWLDSGRM